MGLAIAAGAKTSSDGEGGVNGERAGDGEVVVPAGRSAGEMHVDGDVLAKVTEKRLLERVVGDAHETFWMLLTALDEGRWAEDLVIDCEGDGKGGEQEQRREKAFALGYRVLAYFLEPVL